MDVSRRVSRYQGQNVMYERVPGPKISCWWMTHDVCMFFVRDSLSHVRAQL